MDPRQQQQQQPQEPPLFLPAYWTPTDQVIMEDLLLRPPSHDASAPLAMTSTSYSSSSSSLVSGYLRADSISGFKSDAPRIKVKDQSSRQHYAGNARSRSNSGSMSATSSCSDSSPCSSTSAFASTADLAHQQQLQQRRAVHGAATTDAARPSKVTDEERRARHRAVQKRFVQRKKEAIKQTKRLAAELEQQYQFLQIASEQRFLAKENEVLQAQCAAAAAASAAGGSAIQSVEPWRLLLNEHMELVREFYEPLTHDAWTALLRKNLEEYELACLDKSYLTSGLTVMGWHDQRKIDNSSVKFVLSKEFPHICALELMEKTWHQLGSPETHARFFSPVFTVKVQVLQVMNENARVIHRALYSPQTGNISHGLELLCRVRRGNEFIIFESAVENNAVHACLGASHRWSQMTVSQVFSPSSNSSDGGDSDKDGGRSTGCIYRHGGSLRQFVAANVKYWLMEMFFMALRYESGMVSPIFCLAAE